MVNTVTIATYNVLVDWCTEYNGGNTGINHKYVYSSRVSNQTALIRSLMPDSFGVQEASLPMKKVYTNDLHEYDVIGTMDTGGADDPAAFGTFIFYNKEKYRVIESAAFWLSETPDKSSMYLGADRPRNGCYCVLENRTTSARYAHVNAHVEWKTKDCNSFGTRVVRSYVDKLAQRGLPVFCTGDFNVDNESYQTAEIMTAPAPQGSQEAYHIADAFDVAAETSGSRVTHFDVLGWALDRIYVTTDNIDVLSYRTEGNYEMSDHLPVIITANIHNK